MRAYFDRPEETARVLSADGWLDTGDLGYFADGQIVITGRAKDLIIVNGRNIWPQDLEWTAEAEAEALRSGDVAAFSVDRGRRRGAWSCWSSAAPATPAVRAGPAGRGRQAAPRPPRRRGPGGAGAAARPAPDLVGQAQPLVGQGPLSCAAPSSPRREAGRSGGMSRALAAVTGATGFLGGHPGPRPRRSAAGACASWPAATPSAARLGRASRPRWSRATSPTRRPCDRLVDGRRRGGPRRRRDQGRRPGRLHGRQPRRRRAHGRSRRTTARPRARFLLVSSLAAREPQLSRLRRQQARPARRRRPRDLPADG